MKNVLYIYIVIASFSKDQLLAPFDLLTFPTVIRIRFLP